MMDGVKIIDYSVREDKRGNFIEAFKVSRFPEFDLKQVNSAVSYTNSFRGIHGQTNQARIFRVPIGIAIVYVVHPVSLEFEEYMIGENNNMAIYAPQGYGWGYRVLTQKALIEYYCDAEYDESRKFRINYRKVGIKQPVQGFIISDEDDNA